MSAGTHRDKPSIELREVSKYFGDRAALNKVWLEIAPGDSVLIYGANGAGKTTLLQTMAGLSLPTEGLVLFSGREFRRNSALVRSRIGFVSHSTFLYDELTVSENLKFMGTLFGVDHLERRIDEVLELFGVRERAGTLARELSRGLQQRVSLARAFLHDPTFLLLDEPFTGLDARTAEHLHGILQELPEQRKALVFSTHDFEQGTSIARRLVAMERGRVRYDGPLKLAPLDALGIVQEHPTGATA
ncbi:MAG TPA: ABC transporter ATP-binding protein [Terriglobia bacterium]|jgi:ABC-type multidrug transport system ATPase subunit|nr:ABC transporter ATP-binding protein [Terriglobia bacterium]